jgi:ADP-heptose:LPS heptosyltransferase
VVADVQPVLAQVDRRPEDVRCAGDRIRGVRRILVVRNDRLGDVVLTLPAVRALRIAYPRAWIGLLVRRSVAAFASLATDVDELVVDRPGGAPIEALMGGFRPDVTVCIARSYRVARAAHRLRLPNRIGTGRRPYSFLFDRRVEEPRRGGGRHEVEYALSFAHRIGAPPGPAEFPLKVPAGVVESCENWLAMHGIVDPFVVLHPGSGGSCPAWPIDHHVQLAAVLAGRGVPVVFSVGPDDDDVHQALDDEARVIRQLPRLSNSAHGLAGLLQRAAVVVASSTGPAHLAAALDTPTLAFHAPWNSCGVARWGPYSTTGWGLIAELSGAPHWSRGRRRAEGPRLMEAVTPTLAAKVVTDLMDGRSPELPPAPGRAGGGVTPVRA